MKKYSLFAFMLIFLLSGCLRDVNDTVTRENIPDPDILENYVPAVRNVNASVIGFVVDENDDPVAGATVRLGSLNTTTDDFGHFFFENRTMNALGTLVRVEMSGYFNGSRRFFPAANAVSRLKIELLPKAFTQSFEAQTGGQISVTGGGNINFEAGSIAKAGGEVYTGTVLMASQWLDPSNPDIFDRMPGGLQGVDVRNDEVALRTYGMMAVELEGPDGESLNLLDGETATITMPIPAAMAGNAPAEIPLWSYSETYGVWVEEGSAVLSGSNYVGTVGHFSFWNCDYPYPLVEFEATFVDTEGSPLQNFLVSLVLQGSYAGNGYTNLAGTASGLIPADEVFTMNVYNICHEVIYSETIGPFSEDVSLGPITVEGTSVNSTVITGELIDCDTNPVEEGLVIASYNGQTSYHYVDAGTFEIAISTCESPTTIELIAYDLSSLTQSQPVAVQAGQPTNLGSIEVCDVLTDDYVLVVIGTQTALFTSDIGVSVDSARSNTWIFAYGNDPGTQGSIHFSFEGITTGNYDTANFYESIFHSGLGWQYSGGSFTTFNVTAYGLPGSQIVGSFSGTVEQQGATQPISGEFRVTR